MLKEFRRLTPSFSFYIYNFRNMKRMYGKNSAGTVHTIVRRPQFHRRNREGITMAEWLRDAVRA